MAEKRAFLSSSVRIDGVFDVLILLVLSGSWLGLLGGWHWALDLCSHFRWQYLAACLVAVIWTAWRGRRWVMMVSVASLLLNGWLIGKLGFEVKRGPVAGGERLRVVSLNVLTSNSNQEGVLEYLRNADADVIFLMEVDAGWVRSLEALKKTHPHGLIESREDNFGVALFSRVPLEDVEVIELGDAGVPSIEARLMFQQRLMVILGTHTLPPTGPAYSAERDAQLRQTAVHVAGLKAATLVVGDLNVTPWSCGMRLITEGGTLGYRSSKPAWRPTWRVGTVLAIPIDHALCTEALRIVGRTVGPDVGSDHRPLVVDVGWDG